MAVEELEVVDGVVVAVVDAVDVPVVVGDDDTVTAPIPAADVGWVADGAPTAADTVVRVVDVVGGVDNIVETTGTAVGSSVITHGLPAAGVDDGTAVAWLVAGVVVVDAG